MSRIKYIWIVLFSFFSLYGSDSGSSDFEEYMFSSEMISSLYRPSIPITVEAAVQTDNNPVAQAILHVDKANDADAWMRCHSPLIMQAVLGLTSFAVLLTLYFCGFF